MILRLVRATLLPGRFDRFRAGLERGVFPAMTTTPGLVRAHVGLRRTDDGDEVLFVTAWELAEVEMSALGGEVDRMLEIPGVSEHVLVTGVDHFEVDSSTLPTDRAVPVVLRTAAGWIDQGPDAEIQQELRRRLPSLGPELVEAWVGRRMRGKSVEVVFVGAWSRVPEQSLLEPIWPDISARYHAFTVETWEPLLPTGDGHG